VRGSDGVWESAAKAWLGKPRRPTDDSDCANVLRRPTIDPVILVEKVRALRSIAVPDKAAVFPTTALQTYEHWARDQIDSGIADQMSSSARRPEKEKT
jgi:hypothetical protein